MNNVTRRRTRLAFSFMCAAVMAVTSHAQQTPSSRLALPADPIAGIVEAFQSHTIVALGEGIHGNEQGHAFRLSLVRDRRFAATVNDIVVEFGNARYQDVMDRFVRGEQVSDDNLRQVWQNTTATGTGWDRPIYEEFFRAVRDVNATRPKEQRLRVLLGDPPIDWDSVKTRDDLMKWMVLRDSYPADLIQREVIAKRRRALVIYGDPHVFRRLPGLVGFLEAAGASVFAVSTNMNRDLQKLQPDMPSWRFPSLAIVKGTQLGETMFTSYFPLPGAQWASLRLEDQFDALLYLGLPSSITMSPLAPARCLDPAYIEMRARRRLLDPGPPGAPNPVDALTQYCASAPKTAR
jgi:hypothetical protein